ncbi:MAG: hypothetical protein LBU23_08900 [Planctomycetota bacterium]|jgi:hypothetical protein|nr:hypothetical protein [Planctomycetota bacterium]
MFDTETLFSNEQYLIPPTPPQSGPTPPASNDSTFVVDAGKQVDAGSNGGAVLAVVLGGGNSGTLTISVNTSDDSDGDDLGSAVTVASFVVPAAKVAKGGAVLSARLPSGCKRYLRLHYANASGGNVTAGLVQGFEGGSFPLAD